MNIQRLARGIVRKFFCARKSPNRSISQFTVFFLFVSKKQPRSLRIFPGYDAPYRIYKMLRRYGIVRRRLRGIFRAR